MASLLVMRGVLEGEYFKLPDEPTVSIGRDDECTLQLLDPTISQSLTHYRAHSFRTFENRKRPTLSSNICDIITFLFRQAEWGVNLSP